MLVQLSQMKSTLLCLSILWVFLFSSTLSLLNAPRHSSHASVGASHILSSPLTKEGRDPPVYQSCHSTPMSIISMSSSRGVWLCGGSSSGGGSKSSNSISTRTPSRTVMSAHGNENHHANSRHVPLDAHLQKHDNSHKRHHTYQQILYSLLRSNLSVSRLLANVQKQYAQRMAADPNFLSKSITEVILAAGTQFMAEIGKRGPHQIMTEIDFVVAGILTAIAGKYYSMWRVAPTAEEIPCHDGGGDASPIMETNSSNQSSLWDVNVIPTNAFQTNRPYTPSQRLMSFVVPMPSLFQAGVFASAIGYGFTSFLIFMRSIVFPTYEAATVHVNTLHACLYTGAFMAIVSNIRYQLLQGIIEPYFVDKLFGRIPLLRASMTFAVRLANGLLGSFLAIGGMKMMGLQKLKS